MESRFSNKGAGSGRTAQVAARHRERDLRSVVYPNFGSEYRESLQVLVVSSRLVWFGWRPRWLLVPFATTRSTVFFPPL